MEPTDEQVVRTAAEAAEGLIFSRYSRSDVDDLDVTVRFEDGVLEIDVYLNAGEESEQVAEDAVRAAESAVDELFEESES
ncbi:MAG: DUF3194 domain-containing protein [Euryarchaeota archaeon]|nr:DUF3194 domain-containing protein [Euryarchaeota archaeon]